MRLVYTLMLVLQASLPIFAVDVYEGDSTTLVFQEPLDETSIYTVFFNDVTIFENGSPVEGSLPEGQLSRMDIQDSLSSGLINVHMTIQNVERSDAGTYSLHINPATDSFVEENIDLLVIYEPSNLECKVINNTLNCNATQGYPRDGMISCYQGAERLQNLLQEESSETIAARYRFFIMDSSIDCCTESSAFVSSPGNCTQFTWYVPQRVQAPSTILPPRNMTILPAQNITILENMTRVFTTTEVPLETDILYPVDWLSKYRATIGFMCGVLFVFVVLYPFGMAYHFRVYMKKPRKYVSDSKGRGHFDPISSV